MGTLTLIVAVAPNNIWVGGLTHAGLATLIQGGFRYSTRYSVGYFTVVTSKLGLLPVMSMFPDGVTLATE